MPKTTRRRRTIPRRMGARAAGVPKRPLWSPDGPIECIPAPFRSFTNGNPMLILRWRLTGELWCLLSVRQYEILTEFDWVDITALHEGAALEVLEQTMRSGLWKRGVYVAPWLAAGGVPAYVSVRADGSLHAWRRQQPDISREEQMHDMEMTLREIEE